MLGFIADGVVRFIFSLILAREAFLSAVMCSAIFLGHCMLFEQ